MLGADADGGLPHNMDYPQKDDPNQLGMRCNALPAHQMALITSGCVPTDAEACTGRGAPRSHGRSRTEGTRQNRSLRVPRDPKSTYYWPGVKFFGSGSGVER